MKTISFLFVLFIALGSVCAQRTAPANFTPPQFFDTYHEFWNQRDRWTIFNVHDPSIHKDGEWFYMYNTDVSLGGGTPIGGHKRRSRDLINWEFLGTAFEGIPQSAVDFFRLHNPNFREADVGIWAPFLFRAENEWRLYYSAPGGLVNQNLAFLGFATSQSAGGPWIDRGRVASSIPGDTINAIDPSVVINVATGQHWMVYGSYEMGMYMVELNPATGGLLREGDRGHIVARRSGTRHAAIEGPEVIHRDGWYYLFVSYDWLGDFYNVRVGRSRVPEGPYFDFHGRNMAEWSDNFPMILFPYRFNHHVGWQGTGHNSVFRDGDRFFTAHQGRPSSSPYNMVLHVREIFWIDGWPVLSPQRYAAVPQSPVTPEMIVGEWEHIPLVFDRSRPNLRSVMVSFQSNGHFNNRLSNTWEMNGDTLIMRWGAGHVDRLIVRNSWDWENRNLTLTFTGMRQDGLNVWGKKIDRDVIDRNTVLRHGSAYVIRNHHSNMLIDVAGSTHGSNVRQWSDTGTDNQEWVLVDTGDGYFVLIPMNTLNNTPRMALEVALGSPANGANVRIGELDFSDAQRWRLEYRDNGFFAIRSKISNDLRGLDVGGFSILNGGNIMQWEFLNGLNQLWRFERTRTGVNTGFSVGTNDLADAQHYTLSVYPNPAGQNSEIRLSFGEIPQGANMQIHVRNMTGSLLYSNEFIGIGSYQLDNAFAPGVYIISLIWDGNLLNEKLIVY